MLSGKFIAIYGINNIGKTTQAKLLTARLNSEGHRAVHVKYPVYDLEPTGPKIDSVLRSDGQNISEEELQGLFVQNRIDFEPQLIKYLEEGTHVIAEDYTGTGIAWGAAKGADLEWLEKINSKVRKEDFIIYLEGKRFLEAKEEKHIHETNDKLIAKCIKVFEHLRAKYGWHPIEVVDGVDIVGEDIWTAVKSFLEI